MAAKKKNKKKIKNFSFKNCEGAKYEVIFNKPNAKHFGEDTEGVCHPPN